MSNRLLAAIRERVLLGDGGMGTQLQQAGLQPGECGEAWNLTHPERVLAVQRRYVEAGSDCLITNTFGGSPIMLARHGQAEATAEINAAAARIAREAFGDRDGFVLGDIGPFGGLMEPFGDVTEQEVRDAFRQQADALVAAGVDAVIVETQTALDELRAGVEAARAAGATCVIGSMAYDAAPGRDAVRTMMGVGPEQAAQFMQELGVDIVAMNCGSGIDASRAADVVRAYSQACDLPTMAQPNAGRPELVDGQVVYRQSADEMAAQLPDLLEAGVRIVGACCGSTPEHIAKFRAVLDAR
ncbi:MAG: homocysteine methyltransferase [Planctomycetaceae bacterium]|nr:homocysteine methyltransferase [Planctomycetaceae bacterium]